MTAFAGPLAAAGCLIGLASVVPALADEGRFYETGTGLYAGCAKDSPKRAETTRYVAGFADSHRLAAQDGAARPFCIPEAFSASQVTDTVCLALQRYTEIRHRPAAYTVMKALKDAYPCR